MKSCCQKHIRSVSEYLQNKITKLKVENKKLNNEVERFHDMLHEAEDENERLKDDLLEYGRHSEGCNYPYNPKYGCKCGFKSVLDALKGGEK